MFFTDIDINRQGSQNGRLCLKPSTTTEYSIVHFEYDLVLNNTTLIQAGTYYIPEGGICFPNGVSGGLTPPEDWPTRWD